MSTEMERENGTGTDETPARVSQPGREGRGGRLWAQARGAFFALPRGLHVVMLVIFMVLGFALATQVRSQRSDPLEGLSEQDLVTVLDELGTQEQNLRTRRGELASELEELQGAADEADAREQAARKAAQQAQIAAGTIAVHGPGVSLSVVDPGAQPDPHAVRHDARRAAQRRSGGNRTQRCPSLHALCVHRASRGHHRRWHTHRVAVHVERDRGVTDDCDGA